MSEVKVEKWDVEWMTKDGVWMPYKPFMSQEDALELFHECITVRPSSEKFRLVRITTMVDVLDERSGGKS